MEARLIAAERVTRLHRRREALLRQARRFAAETDPQRLLNDLVRDAIDLVGGSAGLVTRWDEGEQALVPVGTNEQRLTSARLRLGQGASGRAADKRAPVLVSKSSGNRAEPLLALANLRSAVAVPLLHEARLVGTLAVGSDDPNKTFTQQDTELIEMLASTAAAAIVALEHARLDGVLLAARTAQHELNNQLAVARGYAEMLVGRPICRRTWPSSRKRSRTPPTTRRRPFASCATSRASTSSTGPSRTRRRSIWPRRVVAETSGGTRQSSYTP